MLKRKTTAALLLTASLFFSALSSLPALAKPVEIKGQRLSEISDIVKTVTSSDFPEIPKHSLMLLERKTIDGDVSDKPRVFLINRDGSLKKDYDPGYSVNGAMMPISPRLDVVQKMNVSISPKPFGKRRNVFFSTAGLTDNYNSRYAFMGLESNGTEENAKITNYGNTSGTIDNRNIWGNACLQVQGMEDKDVFVIVHSSKMAETGNLYFKFITIPRDESTDLINHMDDISVDGDNGDSLGWKVFDYSNGIRGVDIAAGDFDGDGYKNEIAMTWNQNNSSWLYVYQVKQSGDSLSITQLFNQHVDNVAGIYDNADGYMGYKQSYPNVVVGDFDGDGRDEAAFVGRVYPDNVNSMRVGILDYNDGIWNYVSTPISEDGACAPCRATRCDFDGDGKDEIAVLFFPEIESGLTYPRLERWYCDAGSIVPHRDESHKKGGIGDTSVLGYTIENSDDYYKTIEELQITAGPLTGTKGKTKLAEDVAISHVYADASRVFVIPTTLDTKGDFAGFGDTQKIYEDTTSDSIRRGTVITADFMNEALLLGAPRHTQDDHDDSYVAVLQALPYHVDNVDTNGNLTDKPINYTFSGFGDMADGIAGKMRVAYSSSHTSESSKSATFGLASTTETVALLGDAGESVAGAMSFGATVANIAGNFDSRVKEGAEVYNNLMDFVTDKINTTTTEASASANSATIREGFDARQFDRFIVYSAAQHIWRYKILNDPLPSWYALGPKADYVSKDLSNAQKRSQYITFSMYDDAVPSGAGSDTHYLYQERHEEGNFFSYPSQIEDIEGYTASGALLSDPYRAAWAKSDTGMAVKFEQSKIDSQTYDEHIEKSGLTKTISAIAAFFGAKDPDPLPPYTSHSEAFVKKYSSSETISIDVYGRTTLPGEAASHTLMAMPYTTREGTMKVGTAVSLLNYGYPDSPELWRTTSSRYYKYPDPALVLPYKYAMFGATFAAANQVSASKVRGLRFYIPSLDLDSDNTILGGLQYKIKVPIYNASFLDANSFDVSLSYVSGSSSDIDLAHPNRYMSNLRPIQTVTMSLKGWQNGSRLNKGWAEFTWDVPATLYDGDGTYYFYIQIDPSHGMQEVHESRMTNDTVVDVGGNNEGYFRFSFSSPGSLENKQTAQANGAFKAAAHSGDGTIFRTTYRSGGTDGEVRSATTIYDTTGKVSINTRFIDESRDVFDDVEIIQVFGLIEDIAYVVASHDYIPLMCEVTYTGAEYYPEAYFYGVNYKPGALDAVSGDRSKLTNDSISKRFLAEKLPLVPNKTTRFLIHIHPGEVDWVNGAGFELVVPELVSSNSGSGGSGDSGGGSEYSEGVSTSSGGGCEAVTGSLAMMIFAGAIIFKKARRE
ncbi:MAG: hypothetical protein IJQ74_04895 [Synergistaceae bacterium]|nr:hypothetical protein [Synergistaceae bacterium]